MSERRFWFLAGAVAGSAACGLVWLMGRPAQRFADGLVRREQALYAATAADTPTMWTLAALAEIAGPNGMSEAPVGQLLAALARLTRAVRILQVGVSHGYLTAHMAAALPAGVACVTALEHLSWDQIWEPLEGTATQRAWRLDGISDRITVTACEEDYGIALQGLVDAGNSAAFDMVVMDMQHALRRDLYDLAVRLVREGGVVAVLWSLADIYAPFTKEWNSRVLEDERVHVVALPLGAGITLLLRSSVNGSSSS